MLNVSGTLGWFHLPERGRVKVNDPPIADHSG
jgi:hypothetical protein